MTSQELFLSHSVDTFERMTSTILSCLDRLTDDQVWQRGSAPENAIGNLILHLCGNIRQWIGHSVGGLPDVRVRPAEFAEYSSVNLPKEELRARLTAAVAEAVECLKALPPERLTDTVDTQDGTSPVLPLIYRVVGHFQQHTGQIIHATKSLLATDLSLYQPPALPSR